MSGNSDQFAKAWRKTFEHQNVKPADAVWDRIDASLSKEETGYFKRRLVFFKLVAAASIFLAITLSIFSWVKNDDTALSEDLGNIDAAGVFADSSYVNDQSGPDQIQTSISGRSETTSGVGSDNSMVSEKQKSNEQNKNFEIQIDENHSHLTANLNQNAQSANQIESFNQKSQASDIQRTHFNYNAELLNKEGIVSVNLTASVIEEIYIPYYGYEIIKPVEESTTYLAGLDFSAGVFNPNLNQSNSGLLAFSADEASSPVRFSNQGDANSYLALNQGSSSVQSTSNSIDPSSTVSYGINFGINATRKVVFYSGLHYVKTSSQVNNALTFESASDSKFYPVSAFNTFSESSDLYYYQEQSTKLENKYEYASVPLKIGYRLLSKKFNITFVTGISSEILLNSKVNVINGVGGSYGEVESADIYNSVYINGLLGAHFGYLLGKRYLISVEPNVRKALTPMTNDNISATSLPSTFLMSYGLSYQF